MEYFLRFVPLSWQGRYRVANKVAQRSIDREIGTRARRESVRACACVRVRCVNHDDYIGWTMFVLIKLGAKTF